MNRPYERSELEELLGEYFGPGWRDDGSSTEDVLRVMRCREPAPRLQAAHDDLVALLDRGLCEPQLLDLVLYELGCDAAPHRTGEDVREWLGHVQRALAMNG